MKIRALLGVAILGAASSFGGAVITNGFGVYLGVNDEGHLNNADGPFFAVNAGDGVSVGVAADFTGSILDATSPGCLCEGWGAAYDGTTSGWANIASGGTAGITPVSFASTASTATSVVTIGGLSVTHDFAPAAATPYLFEGKITLTNTTGAAMTSVMYQRTMDWDIPPTEFSEYVTILGTGPALGSGILVTSTSDGFDTPDPLDGSFDTLGACPINSDYVDCGTADHGANFLFNFGGLAAGESKTFTIFYGAAPSEAHALGAVGAVGAEIVSFGQQAGDPATGTPTTYIWGFKGVGGKSVVPEPSTYAMLASALVGLGVMRFRRK